jgi:hypothetical protein
MRRADRASLPKPIDLTPCSLVSDVSTTAAVGSLQRADSIIRSIGISISRATFNARRLSSALDQNETSTEFQMRGKRNFQMRRKFFLDRGRFHNKISVLDLAGAGGIESEKKPTPIIYLTSHVVVLIPLLIPKPPCFKRRGTKIKGTLPSLKVSRSFRTTKSQKKPATKLAALLPRCGLSNSRAVACTLRALKFGYKVEVCQ